jgi:hypothetical protein
VRNASLLTVCPCPSSRVCPSGSDTHSGMTLPIEQNGILGVPAGSNGDADSPSNENGSSGSVSAATAAAVSPVAGPESGNNGFDVKPVTFCLSDSHSKLRRGFCLRFAERQTHFHRFSFFRLWHRRPARVGRNGKSVSVRRLWANSLLETH